MAILDTAFLIALEQAEDTALAWLEAHQHEEHIVPDVVAVEYLTGHTQAKAAHEALEQAFRIVGTDRAWIESATQYRKRLRERRIRFRTPDLWIAAWAIHLDQPVVTTNERHFKALGVPIETW